MDKKQEAIELLKKETTDLANVYKKDGGFVLSGTYEQEEIGPGDYFIARKPKDGDFMYSTWGEGTIVEDTAIYILRGEYKGEKEEVKFYAKINPNNKLDYNATIGTFYPRKDRFATYAEKKELLATLEENGMVWNSEKRQIEDLPKHAFTEDDLKNIGIMVAVNEIPSSREFIIRESMKGILSGLAISCFDPSHPRAIPKSEKDFAIRMLMRFCEELT